MVRLDYKTSIFFAFSALYAIGFLLTACAEEQTDSSPPPDVPLAEQMSQITAGKSTSIVLGQTRIGDPEAAKLAQLKNLVIIRLGETDITDEGLAKLATLPNLEGIRLASTQITDDGLAGLATSRSIKFIHLIDAKITDTGLPYLYNMIQLESLYLTRSKITEKGVDALKRKLPGLHVHY